MERANAAAFLHLMAGQMGLEEGKHELAKVQYAKSLALWPRNFEAARSLGLTYLETGDLDQARSSLNEAYAMAEKGESLLDTTRERALTEVEEALAKLGEAVRKEE